MLRQPRVAIYANIVIYNSCGRFATRGEGHERPRPQ
jgi:hypothetical protein